MTIYLNEVDIILGSSWMETLGTFILNMKKKFLTFSYKKKKITLHDSTWKSDLVTSEDLKNISKIIIEDSQKSITKMQKEFDKVAVDKEEEIFRLRDHSHKLFLQIKKVKDKAQDNQKLEEENQDLQKKLLENIEENGRLKNHNQDLMDHI